MKNRRGVFLAAVLLLSAVLSGCGDKKKDGNMDTTNVSANSVVMMVGDQQVRYREVQAYRYFLKCQYEGSFGEELWEYPLDGTETIGDQAKQEIVNMITQLKIISHVAEEQNVTLTADESDEALQHAQELVAEAKKGDRKKYFLNVQEIAEIYEENALANKMFYMATNDADTNVTDEEARQVSLQMIQIVTDGRDRNGMEIVMDEAEKEEALKRAKNLWHEAQKEEDFLSFAQKNTDVAQTEFLLGRDSDLLEKSILGKVLRMKTGELSEVLEGARGYYIVYCVNEQDEDATYRKKEEIIEQRQAQLFMQSYAQWMKNQKVDINQKFWNDFKI